MQSVESETQDSASATATAPPPVNGAEVAAMAIMGTAVFIHFGAALSLGETVYWPLVGLLPLRPWLYMLLCTILICLPAYIGGKGGRHKKLLLCTALGLLLLSCLVILHNLFME